jgi:hypothetical protein
MDYVNEGEMGGARVREMSVQNHDTLVITKLSLVQFNCEAKQDEK